VDHPSLVINGQPEEQALRTNHVPTTALDDALHILPNASHVGREAMLRDWTSQVHALGYKAIAYYNGLASTWPPRAGSLVAEGRANNYFVRLANGEEFLTSA